MEREQRVERQNLCVRETTRGARTETEERAGERVANERQDKNVPLALCSAVFASKQCLCLSLLQRLPVAGLTRVPLLLLHTFHWPEETHAVRENPGPRRHWDQSDVRGRE